MGAILVWRIHGGVFLPYFDKMVTTSLALVFLTSGCGETPPDDVLNYAQRDDCVLLNVEPIPPTPSDPHIGFKDVYACNITVDDLLALNEETPVVYPDGTLILKSSRREHQDYAWLLATAVKTDGAWEWTEYKRNFEDEDFLSIPVSQSVCVNCHKAAESLDYIFTKYGGEHP